MFRATSTDSVLGSEAVRGEIAELDKDEVVS
jgi:hypothetical protein